MLRATLIPGLLLLAFFASSQAWGETARLAVRAEECRAAVEFVPGGDTAYVPGRDVRGRPVVPAEGGQPSELPIAKDILVFIEVDLAKLGRRGSGYDAAAAVGALEQREGQFFFNGQPLEGEQRRALAAACREGLRTLRQGG